ncbi:MAG: PKD domain-containing protein, partial [Anaerolineales bacterium]|nr:PKD domain-containing protein [Anaerolineales bacterium]
NPGQAQIYHGSAGAPPRMPARTLTANRANDQFGKSVSTAKDVNGDTYADVLIGAPDRSFGQFHEGAAYVYYGAPGGIITNTAWISESNVIYSQMGLKVASADVNGDARGDVIIGQYGTGTSPNFTGRVLVYYGSPAGISNPPSWIATDPDQYLELGMHVATAGDVNGDGYDDVMAQAYMYSDGSATVGAVLVWHGSETGLGHAGPYLYGADWMAVGNQAWGMFGLAGGKAGDVNSDGYDDLLVTAPWYDVTSGGNFTEAGAAFLYYGSASGLGEAGTVANADWAFYGDKTGAYLGRSASEMGDFNQDGYDDFVIGGGQYSDAFATEGKIWVFYGSPSGPGSAPNWTQKGFNKYALFGEGVGPGGDINHDGYADLLVGAPRHGFDESNGYPSNRGRVYVYFGRPSLGGLSAMNDGPSEIGHLTTFTTTLNQGRNVFYQWDFGDGSPLVTSPLDAMGEGGTTLHTYSAAGIFTARVRAFDGLAQVEAETTVQVFEDLTFIPGETFTTTDQVLSFEIPSGLEAGVTITSINLGDVQPPREVADAFAEVVRAGQNQQQLINEAEQYRNQQFRLADGEAAKLIEDANAYKASVVAQAEGES